MPSDKTIIRVVDNISARFTRVQYEEFLVELGIYRLSTLRTDPDYVDLSKRDLVFKTFHGEKQWPILQALFDSQRLSQESRRALAMDGIEFGHTLAGEIAAPEAERSQLEIGLREQGLMQVHDFLGQALDNFAKGNYEAANAMTRTALEQLIMDIAGHISRIRGNETIPYAGRHIGPVDYRNYLHATRFLDEAEKRHLDAFYGYGSTRGSHPGVSSESDARLRRFVVVAIALLFLEKLANQQFMAGLAP